MFFKKTAKAVFTALALVGLAAGLSACGKTQSSKTYTPKNLTVEFVPSRNAGKMEAKAKPLAQLMSKQLGIPVKVTIATDYNTIVEAMGSKKVDVGFLPPDAYVLAHKQYKAKTLLQAERYDYKGTTDESTNNLVNHYRSQILVRKDSGINSIKDLKGKKIAVQDTTSTSGYIFPAVEMLDHGVNINKNGIKTVQVKGHDQGILSVLNKNTDAAFVFQGARHLVKKDDPQVMTDMKSIYTTKNIPNDTVTVRGDMSEKWQKKIATALKDIAKTKDGHQIISALYDHDGYTDSKDSNFDIIREYDKKAEQLNK